jgi:hypothetical protein
MNRMWIILLIVLLSVLVFIASHFSPALFKIANYLFFMSFIVSLYALYTQEERTVVERDTNGILVTMAEVETNPQPAQIILLLEKIQIMNPSLLQPNHLGKRIRHVMETSHFDVFWKHNKQYYDPQFVTFISPLV